MTRSSRSVLAAALAPLALAPALALPAAAPATAAAPPVAPPVMERIGGADRYATAAALSRRAFPTGAPVVVVATGASFPDALAGAPALVGLGPVLLVQPDGVPDVTREEVRRLAPQAVVVLGGPAAVSDRVLADLAALAPGGARRVAGADRVETAAAVAEVSFERGVPLAVVAAADSFADALAGSALAGARTGPVLLTGRDRLPEVTAAALRALSPARIVVVGGADRVGEPVLAELAGLTAGRVVRRSGPDRATTSAVVSREELRRSRLVFLATGRDFPDALSAAAVAGPLLAPLLLVDDAGVPAAVRCELQRLAPEAVVVLGGEAAVPLAVEREVATLPTGTGPCSPSPGPAVPGGNGRVPALPADPAVGYQMSPAHDGSRADGDPRSGLPVHAWTAPLDGLLSFPLVADGRVFLTRTVPGSATYGTEVVALDGATGRLLWRDRLAHTYYSSGLAWDRGTLYALGYDSPLQARDPATGRVRWVAPDVGGSDTPPAAEGGRVYTSGNGAVSAVDGTSGALLWRSPVLGGQKSTPAVTEDGVFVGYSCSNTHGFVPASGQQIWVHRGDCSGGGGRTTATRDGLLYTRGGGTGGNLVLDSASGRVVGVHGGDLIPALWEGGTVTVAGPVVSGTDTRGTPRWALDGLPAPVAPVVANGAAWLATADGRLLAVDARDGAVLATVPLPAAPFPVDEHNVSAPLAGIAVGEGLLVVPHAGGVTAYRVEDLQAVAGAAAAAQGAGAAPPAGTGLPAAPDLRPRGSEEEGAASPLARWLAAGRG